MAEAFEIRIPSATAERNITRVDRKLAALEARARRTGNAIDRAFASAALPRTLSEAARRTDTVAGAQRRAAEDTKKAARDLKQAGLESQAAANRVDRAWRRTGAILRSVATVAATLGIAVGVAASVRTIADLGRELSRVRAIQNENVTSAALLDAQMQAVARTARDLGATTVFTATEAATGIRLLTQAGFDAQESLAAIPGALNLAAAGAIDLASAADITANAVRAFSLDASQATEVADSLAVASTQANTTVLQLGEGLKFAAPAAAAVGRSVQETVAALGVLSNAGLKATLAGTGLRRVLVGLTEPDAAVKLRELGIEIAKVDPRANKLSQVFRGLAEGQLDLTKAVELFGVRGGPAALVLSRLSEDLARLEQRVEASAGAAERMADIVLDNLAGDLRLLTSAVQEATLSLGDAGLTGGLRGLTQDITGTVRALSGALDPIDTANARFFSLAGTVRGVGLAVLTFAGVRILGAMISGLLSAASAARSMSLAVTGLGISLKAAQLAIAPLAVAVSVIAAGLVFFITRQNQTERATKALNEALAEELLIIRELRQLGPAGAGFAVAEIEARVARQRELLNTVRFEILAAQGELTRLQLRGLRGRTRRFEPGPDEGFIERFFRLQAAPSLQFGAALEARGVDIARERVEFLERERDARAQTLESAEEELRIAREALAIAEKQEQIRIDTEALERAAQAQQSGVTDLGFQIAQLAGLSGKAADSVRNLSTRELADLSLASRQVAAEQRAVNEVLNEFGLLVPAIVPPGATDAQREAITLSNTLRGRLMELARVAFQLSEEQERVSDAERAVTAARQALLTPSQRLEQAMVDLVQATIRLEAANSPLALSEEQLAEAIKRVREESLAAAKADRERERSRRLAVAREGIESPFARGAFDFLTELGTIEERLERLGRDTARTAREALTDLFTDPTRAAQSFSSVLEQIRRAIVQAAIVDPLIETVLGSLGIPTPQSVAAEVPKELQAVNTELDTQTDLLRQLVTIAGGSPLTVGGVNLPAPGSDPPASDDTLTKVGELLMAGLRAVWNSVTGGLAGLARIVRQVGDQIVAALKDLGLSIFRIPTGGGEDQGTASQIISALQTAVTVASLFHKGGRVGDRASVGLPVPAGLFAAAARFQAGGVAGLRPGEVPIIAHERELIAPLNSRGKLPLVADVSGLSVLLPGARRFPAEVVDRRTGFSAPPPPSRFPGFFQGGGVVTRAAGAQIGAPNIRVVIERAPGTDVTVQEPKFDPASAEFELRAIITNVLLKDQRDGGPYMTHMLRTTNLTRKPVK